MKMIWQQKSNIERSYLCIKKQLLFRITAIDFCQNKIGHSHDFKGGRRMKKVILLLAVLAVIAVGWFLYFNKGETSTIVGIHEVAYGNLENALEFSGDVVCTNMYSVMSETGGTVSAFYVSEGSKVKAGDSLFDLDSTALNAKLEEAKLRYEALQQGNGTDCYGWPEYFAVLCAATKSRRGTGTVTGHRL